MNNTNMLASKIKGFTLVEMAMVLVIVSLLLSGAFKAVELVENSKVEKLVNDLEAFQISYYTYYDRVGDFPGNGSASDRFIDYDAVGINDGTFFQDLFSQGFITSNEPLAVLVAPGYYFVNHLPTTGTVDLTTGTILGKNQACVTLLEDSYARQLDIAMDDGVWNTGTVRTASAFGSVTSHTLCLEI